VPPSGEYDVLPTYDTLAFKTPEGRTSVWLSRDAYQAFLTGAEKAQDGYGRSHLAFGMAACAAQKPEPFLALGIAPGAFAQAAYEL
jgi:hypothetical protein